MRTVRGSVLLVRTGTLLVCAALVGCGADADPPTASPADQGVVQQEDPPASSAPADDAPPPADTQAPPQAPSETGQVLVTTAPGDALRLDLTFYDLQPAADVADVVGICGVDTSRAMVERMDVAATITSSMAAEVGVHWNVDIMNAPPSMARAVYAVSEFSDETTCEQATEYTPTGVHWDSLEPNAPGTHTVYWVITQAISPEAPAGDRAGMGRIFLSPGVTLAGQNPTHVEYSGTRDVHCQQPGGIETEYGFSLAGDHPSVLGGGMGPDLVCT